MKRDYDDFLRDRMAEITGLDDCPDVLDCITGVVYATVFIGSYPCKDDLGAYLELPGGILNKFLRRATEIASHAQSVFSEWMGEEMPSDKPKVTEYIYPLAAEAVADGLYFGRKGEEEPVTRIVVRTFLSHLCPPQAIKTKDLFIGYNVVLEYLWQSTCGTLTDDPSMEDIHEFCRKRYKYLPNIYAKINDFSELLIQNNESMFSADQGYKEVCDAMVKSLCNNAVA